VATVVRMMTPHSSWCHTRLGVQHAIRLIVTSRGRPDALLDEGAMPVRGCTRVAWERDAAAWLLGRTTLVSHVDTSPPLSTDSIVNLGMG